MSNIFFLSLQQIAEADSIKKSDTTGKKAIQKPLCLNKENNLLYIITITFLHLLYIITIQF